MALVIAPVHIILALPCGEQKRQNAAREGLGVSCRQSQQSRFELGSVARPATA